MVSISSQQTAKPDVAIIGCGPSGLLSLRHLQSIANLTAFEAKDDIGGMWYYTDLTEDNHPNIRSDPFYQVYGYLHSSLYYDLYTNAPKQMMTYKDFYHKEETPFIMDSQTFHKYLQDYSKHFDLYRHINFNTAVKSIRLVKNLTEEEKKKLRIPSDTTKKFYVSWISYKKAPKSDEEFEEGSALYDYVLVCNGRFSKENRPIFEGQGSFEGVQMHMHTLRKLDKETFDNKRILIVGTYVSGTDIISLLFLQTKTMQVTPQKVFVTGRRTQSIEKTTDYVPLFESGKLCLKKGGLKKFSGGKTVCFEDGTEEEIDLVIYATGYLYSMPFLENTGDEIVKFDPETQGTYFGPLYKRMFAINEPDLIFIGLVEKLPIIQATYERQALLARRYIEGYVKLPSKEQMLQDLEKDLEPYAKRDKPMKVDFFKLNEFYNYWDYNEDLLNLSGMEEDLAYKKLKPIAAVMRACTEGGNYWSVKKLDFEELTRGIEFKPVSTKF